MKNTQLKKGILQILILNDLTHGDRYGYEILQRLAQQSQNLLSLKEGTLYPILYRLEDAGSIESYWKNEHEKRSKPRKYYRITASGLADLSKSRLEWNHFRDTVDRMLTLEESHGSEN